MNRFLRSLLRPRHLRQVRHVRHVRHAISRGQSPLRVALLGSPGCGKTTVGRLLSLKLGLPLVDVDTDVLEPTWDMEVAAKLRQVGDANFVQAEGEACMGFDFPESCVLSMTGSNPLYPPFMKRVRDLGYRVFYLDVDLKDILGRLAHMHVDRIVGQQSGTSIADILANRSPAYEACYDVRIFCASGVSANDISMKIQQAVRGLWTPGRLVSTRDVENEPCTFNQAVLNGLAPDGGLYVPHEQIPSFTPGQWQRLVPMNYVERTLRILERWISVNAVRPQTLRSLVERAYGPRSLFSSSDHRTVAPLVQLEDGLHVQELFHGPTGSFKDLALQLTPQLFQNAAHKIDTRDKVRRRRVVLVATSGDTGSAVLSGFQRLDKTHFHSDNTKVIVFYPESGISELQERLMKTSTDSQRSLVAAVRGNFDLCQTNVKRLFTDSQLSQVCLSTANSINWGRLLPQVAYQASSYLDLVHQGHISFGEEAHLCCPSGNFGNVLSAFYAKIMGIPFGKLIAASNENNVLEEFLQKGRMVVAGRQLLRSASPAMDILRPSNVERLLHLGFNGSAASVVQLQNELQKGGYTVGADLKNFLRCHFQAGSSVQSEYLTELRRTFRRTGYVMDPHTAVARSVLHKVHKSRDQPVIISSTAHYGKFADTVASALGVDDGERGLDAIVKLDRLKKTGPRPHRKLLNCFNKSQQKHLSVSGDFKDIRNCVLQFIN